MRVRSVLAVGIAVGLLVSGCSRGQQANDTLPSAASTTAAVEPTLEPLGPPDLPMPAQAREQTPAGAEAFIRYFVDVYNLAQEEVDSQYMRELSQDCSTCDRLASDLDTDADADYHYDGGRVTVLAIGTPGLDGTTAQAAFSISQAPLIIRDTAGEAVAGLSFPQRDSPSCGAVLTWSEATTSWKFAQWDVE